MATTSSPNKMITLDSVSKQFKESKDFAIRDLSLDVNEGEVVVLVGPSGCGKTTTMKMINRLVEPTSGRITVDGEDVTTQNAVELRRRIGYVIQSIGLLPHRTIAQNIATVPNLVGWETSRSQDRVFELAELLELEQDLLGRYPSELSGGQKQRVGVARALAVDPPVMLMDEPFGAVDPIVRGRLQEEFLELQERLRKTIVFVTHDVDEAIKMADRITILNVGGVIEQFATPEEILRNPASEFVEEFVGFERGLKRLALRSVSEIQPEQGPVVGLEATVDQAIAEMIRFDFDWTAVVHEGDVRGWVDREILKGLRLVSEAVPRKFAAYVTPSSTLREALDSIVRSSTNVAVVLTEGQHYEGILTQERISQEILA